MKSALILFSGGIDSTTALYWARRRFRPVEVLTFDYGQSHRIEVEMAERIASRAGCRLHIVELPLRSILASALLGDAAGIPESLAGSRTGAVPATYVPFRNGIFLSLAAGFAESRSCRDLVTGFNSIDSPDYPDTTPAFTRKMAAAINEGTALRRTGGRLKIHTPLQALGKTEIIRLGLKLGADYSESISCYRGDEIPCGRCPSCDIRRQAFAALRLPDPLLERLSREGRI